MQALIIDYGSGNLRSAAKACERVGATVTVSSSAADVAAATHIILPGVGAFADCMAGLTACPGLLEALNTAVLEQKKPFLGICVGMQMLATTGHEHGTHNGLGWLGGEVVLMNGSSSVGGASEAQRAGGANDPAGGSVAGAGGCAPFLKIKIPHMGWNELQVKSHPVLTGIKNGDHAYFVHSYHMKNVDDAVIATTEYGETITAAVAKGNILGTQFHPEKSQETGLTLLKNFMEWNGQ